MSSKYVGSGLQPRMKDSWGRVWRVGELELDLITTKAHIRMSDPEDFAARLARSKVEVIYLQDHEITRSIANEILVDHAETVTLLNTNPSPSTGSASSPTHTTTDNGEMLMGLRQEQPTRVVLPNVGFALLTVFVPRDQLEAYEGDLEEHANRVAVKRGKAWAYYVYWVELTKIVLSRAWPAAKGAMKIAEWWSKFSGG